MRLKDNSKKWLSIYILILSVEYCIEYYSGPLGQVWALFLYRIICLSLVVVSSYMFLKGRKVVSHYRGHLLCFFVYNIVLTILFNLIPGCLVRTDYSVCIYFQILLAICLCMYDAEDITGYLPALFILGIGVALYAYIGNAIDISAVLRRGYAWTSLFYFGGIYWAVVPGILFCFIYNKWKWLGVAYGIAAIAFNSLFLKRYIFVDIALTVIAVLFCLISERKLKVRYTLVALIAIMGFLIGLNKYGDSLINTLILSSVQRLMNSDVSSFERFVESREFFSQATLVEVIVGRGFGGIHYGLGKEASALHVGWTNTILKGGIPYFLLTLIPFLQALRYMRGFKVLPNSQKWCVLVVLVNGIRMVYLNMHSLGPELLIYTYCCIKVMGIRRKNSCEVTI